MSENKIYTFFRKFVIALILLFTFLLPLKFGGIVGVPEATGLFTDQLAVYLIINWPLFLFPFISGILLLLAMLAFPFKIIDFAKDKTLLCASLWVLLAFLSLLGAVNATVWDFVIMEVSHLFGLAAYVLAVYLVLKNVPKAKTLFSASILAGLLMTIYLGFEQYFSGFEQMREYIAEQEKISGTVGNTDLKARIFDDRVHAPFTVCNSLAGYLLLTIPLCLVTLWKLCARVEPPKAARLIFIPLVAACLFFIFFATKSRGAFLALILAAGVFIVFLPVKKWLRWSIIIMAPLLLIGGMVYIYKFGRGFASMQVRVDYIWVSMKLLFQHPFAGTGWGDFFYDYMKMKTIQTHEAPHTPHNLFLAFGGQAGILALLVSIGALFYPLWLGVRKVRSLISEHNYMQEDVALLFGLAAFSFHAMLDIDLQVPGLIATAAALTLLLAMPSETVITTAESKYPRRIIAACTALFVAAGAIVGGWHLTSSEYTFSKLTDLCALSKKTPEQIANISPDEVYEKLKAAVKARPYSPFPYSSAGAFYMGTRQLDLAESCYNKALRLAPECAAYYFRLFSIQDAQGRDEAAKKNLLKAYKRFPNHPKYKLVKEAFIKVRDSNNLESK